MIEYIKNKSYLQFCIILFQLILTELFLLFFPLGNNNAENGHDNNTSKYIYFFVIF